MIYNVFSGTLNRALPKLWGNIVCCRWCAMFCVCVVAATDRIARDVICEVTPVDDDEQDDDSVDKEMTVDWWKHSHPVFKTIPNFLYSDFQDYAKKIPLMVVMLLVGERTQRELAVRGHRKRGFEIQFAE